MGDGVQNVLTSLLTDVIKFCVEWGLKQAETVAMNILGINAQTAAQVTGAQTGAAAQVAGAGTALAANFASIIKSITASAGEAFAGVTGFLAPIMGPRSARAGCRGAGDRHGRGFV